MFSGKHFISLGPATEDVLDVTDEKHFIIPSKMFFPELEFQAGGRYFGRYMLFPSDQFAICKLFLKPSESKPVLYTVYNDNQLDMSALQQTIVIFLLITF